MISKTSLIALVASAINLDKHQTFDVPELRGMHMQHVVSSPEEAPVEHESRSQTFDDDDNSYSKSRVEFDNSFDHDGWLEHGLANAVSRVQVNTTKSAAGDYCQTHQWAFVNWKGWDQRGKLVEDSRKKRGGKPDFFRIGHYEVSKCWDIAVQ